MQLRSKIVIYESAMCCSSGVCGPNPDQALISLQDTLAEATKSGAQVERYSITQNPNKFMENPQVIKLIQEQQLRALPITTIDGNIVKVGGYPTLAELKIFSQAGINAKDSEVIPALTADESCCSGKDVCDIRCSPQYNKGGCGDTGNSCCP